MAPSPASDTAGAARFEDRTVAEGSAADPAAARGAPLVRDVSYDLTTSLQVQYKLKLESEARLKLSSNLAGSRGVDQDGNTTTSMSLSLDAQYSW